MRRTVTIVIASSFEEFKLWCFEKGIDRKSKDCKYDFMINEYSVRGVNVDDVIIVNKDDNSLSKNITDAMYALNRPNIKGIES